MSGTNGVSFSLEAGACCYVKFSNVHHALDLYSKTLNINSTGAKTISMYYYTAKFPGEGSAGHPGSQGSNDILFVYSGSNYSYSGAWYFKNTYSDYSDY